MTHPMVGEEEQSGSTDWRPDRGEQLGGYPGDEVMRALA